MEDFQTRRKKVPNIKEMSKEQIRETLIKKRECNSKAQTIVESLLESGMTESYLLECLPKINQSHFEDVIEERAIALLCGYPMCQNKLSVKDIPKQQYRISLKSNKVYDISDRKSFCSNACYKTAMYIKKQMLTSPLWFREHEDIPQFRLIPGETVESLGKVVDLSLTEKIKTQSTTKDVFTSINEFANLTLKDIPDDKVNTLVNSESPKKNPHTNDTLKIVIETENEQCQHTDHKTKPTLEANNKTPSISANPKTNDTSNPGIIGNIVEKQQRKIDPIITSMEAAKLKKQKSKPKKSSIYKETPIVGLIIHVEKCVSEWFTLDSMILLFGEEKVKDMVRDKGECIKEYLNNYANGLFYSSTSYDQYQQLCRRLNLLELEDRRYNNRATQRELRPLPDYSILHEESKNMDLKVEAFLSGETNVPDVQNISEAGADMTDKSQLTQLPLVDKNAQNALRRKIVLTHLNKVLPDILQSLNLLNLSINSDVRLLVNTFNLKANNIMFKPIQWTLIAIVMVKLLSLRDAQLQNLLMSSTADKHLQLLLLSYKQDGGYLERLLSWLTDVDRLLDVTNTQLTTPLMPTIPQST